MYLRVLVVTVQSADLLFVHFQSLKVLRTSEFLPYIVFLQSPDLEVLKALNQTAVDAGVVTKAMTVRLALCPAFFTYIYIKHRFIFSPVSSGNQSVSRLRMKNCSEYVTRVQRSRQPSATTLTSASLMTTWMRPIAQSKLPWKQFLKTRSGFRSTGFSRGGWWEQRRCRRPCTENTPLCKERIFVQGLGD